MMADQSDFELYGFWRSSATYRARVALNIKGLQAKEHFINVDAGEQRSEAFLKVNPLGGLPALAVKSHSPLTQSVAILEFIDEVHPAPPLLPQDAYGRARVRSLTGMLTADTHPLITPRVGGYLKETAGFDDSRFKTWQQHWFRTGLAAFETRLKSESETGVFCHGDQVTMADICLASIISVARVRKIDIGGMPLLDAIMARCEAMDAFAKADPFKQKGAPAVSS
jgi:maleylacetoacetate isomerase